ARGQKTSMGKRIGHRGNCCGCLYFTKPLIVCKEEGAIVYQRPSEARAELIAHEWRDGTSTKIKVVLCIERSISVEFVQRSVEVITSWLCYRLDDGPTTPAVLQLKV